MVKQIFVLIQPIIGIRWKLYAIAAQKCSWLYRVIFHKRFRKKGANFRNSVKQEYPLHEFHHGANDTETSEQSMKITSCTHLNGHHSIKQSCPKTRTYSIHFRLLLRLSLFLPVTLTHSIYLNLWNIIPVLNHWTLQNKWIRELRIDWGNQVKKCVLHRFNRCL